MPPKKRIPTIDEVLAPGGRLSKSANLTGYQFRPQQAEACHAIEEAFKQPAHCLIEAGTGVGKTLAYLIPAVRAAAEGKKTVISTHTLNLQAQLIGKDIPLVASLFPEVKIDAVVMKGRGNYLCRQDLNVAEEDLFNTTDPLFQEIIKWVQDTNTGDVADLPFSYPHWFEIAASFDTCRQKECRFYDRCFYYKMRRKAGDANLIVVNHALYLSDIAMKRVEPDSALIPDHDYVVFDEAHHLEEVATKAFSIEANNRTIPHFVERVLRIKNLDINATRLGAIDEASEQLFRMFRANRQEFFFQEALDEETMPAAQATATQICTGLEGVARDLLDLAKEEKDARKDRLLGLARTATRLRDEIETLMFREEVGYIRWGGAGLIAQHADREAKPQASRPAHHPALHPHIRWRDPHRCAMGQSELGRARLCNTC